MIGRKWILLLGLFGFVIALYQNCGKVNLQRPDEAQFSSLALTKASGQICIEDSQVLESLIVNNLNVVMRNNALYADSDGDGLSDHEELQLGTDPLNRRSNHQVLDRICQKVDYQVRCENLNLNCQGVSAGWGLNDCDVESLQLDMLYDHPTQGLDSDKDGIADYLEIRSGTFPNISDSTEDPDHDLRSNLIEIQSGTDPYSAEAALYPERMVQVRQTKLAPAAQCSGQLWSVEILNVPVLRVGGFQSSVEPEFNHAENENLVAIVYKTRPKVGVSENAKVYSYIKKLSFDPTATNQVINFSFSTADFVKQGEVEP